jgi:hypothetical protein
MDESEAKMATLAERLRAAGLGWQDAKLMFHASDKRGTPWK